MQAPQHILAQMLCGISLGESLNDLETHYRNLTANSPSLHLLVCGISNCVFALTHTLSTDGEQSLTISACANHQNV